MHDVEDSPVLLARCVVCKGDIYATDPFEKWGAGFYCLRHSLPWLRERARMYGELLRAPSDASRQE